MNVASPKVPRYAYGVRMDKVDLQEALQQWRELLGCVASLRFVAQSPVVIRPVMAVRVVARRVVARVHGARSDLGDAAAALVVRVCQQRPIGIRPIGRFVFGAA